VNLCAPRSRTKIRWGEIDPGLPTTGGRWTPSRYD
jgi:hypothetical protein